MKKQSESIIFWLILPLVIFLYFTKFVLHDIRGYTIPKENTSQTKSITPRKDDFVWDKKSGLVTFWFDDSWETQYTQGYEILRKYDIRASLAVPTKLVGYDAYMDWYQIRRLYYEGWEINPHSRNHLCDTPEKSKEEIEYEVIGSKEDLKEKGIDSEVYVAPCGNTSDTMEEVIYNNFTAQRVVEPGINTIPLARKYAINVESVEKGVTIDDVRQWIKESENNRMWLVMMFHQIEADDNEQYAVSPELFQQIVEEVHNSKLVPVLPSDAIRL